MAFGVGLDCLRPFYIKQDNNLMLRVPCGYCINCKSRKASEWALRLEMESRDWPDEMISFVTLTYNDDNLPKIFVDDSVTKEFLNEKDSFYLSSVNPDDISDFIKRLRTCQERFRPDFRKLRFFGVCEYGTRFGRPHNHILIFGLPSDRKSLELVQDCWSKGFVRLDPFYGVGTCKYVAQYVCKKLFNIDDKGIIDRLRSFESSRQSTRPALGWNWFISHIDELNISAEHPFLDYQGYKVAIPRTFLRKLNDCGLIPKFGLQSLVDKQLFEYSMLCQHLRDRNLNVADYFKQRRADALKRDAQKKSTRIKTGDI